MNTQVKMVLSVALAGVLLCMFVRSTHGGFMSSILTKAWKRALIEQKVEDSNVIYKFSESLRRQCIALPLDDSFCLNKASEMFGKIQYSDKCSLPSSLGQYIFDKPVEAPWLFQIRTVADSVSTEVEEEDAKFVEQEDSAEFLVEDPRQLMTETPRQVTAKVAYCSPLDFRAPENYVFVPRWIMENLGIKNNDLVDIEFVRMKLASLVTLQPLTLKWDELLNKIGGDPKSLLEHEINKFSALTTGSVITIEIEKVEYQFRVVDIKAEGNLSVDGARIQDADVRVDIDRSYLEELILKQKK
jgi:hypothetical protein